MPKIPSKPMPEAHLPLYPDKTGQVALNPTAFEQLIRGHGIRMIHQKPIPCPNQRTLNGNDHDPNCEACYNGYLYYDQTEFIGAMAGNSINKQFGMNGTWDLDQATIIVPSKDANGSEMDFQIFDQILVLDFSVRVYQRVEANQGGQDRLHFPGTSLDKVIGYGGKEYIPGIDCTINDRGYVEWLPGGNRPGYDLTIDSGEIYSVNYYTRPSYTILSLPHQLRGTQTTKAGVSVQERFPQLVVVRKDFIPHQNGDLSGRKDTPEPRDGQL